MDTGTGTTKRIALVGFDVTQIGSSPLNRVWVEYAREHHWKFIVNTIDDPSILRTLPELGCDGALVRITSEAMREAAHEAPFPVVNFSAYMNDTGIPTVCRDDYAMGKLAAEHLLDKGFHRFGILPRNSSWFNQTRTAGVIDSLNQMKAEVSILSPLPEDRTKSDVSRLSEELKKLLFPAGLILIDSTLAKPAYDAVKLAGLKIPLDLAVIGINPEPTDNEPQSPSLSVIDPGEGNCGLHAARLLEQMMNGRPARQMTTLIPPKRLIARDSTDITCYEDRITAQTVYMIRQQAHLPINANDIADSLSISAATLARHCQKHLGMGPYQYLCTTRINEACRLLKKHPKMPLEDVAHAVGMPGRNRFNKVFRRIKGISPVDFRESQLSE